MLWFCKCISRRSPGGSTVLLLLCSGYVCNWASRSVCTFGKKGLPPELSSFCTSYSDISTDYLVHFGIRAGGLPPVHLLRCSTPGAAAGDSTTRLTTIHSSSSFLWIFIIFLLCVKFGSVGLENFVSVSTLINLHVYFVHLIYSKIRSTRRCIDVNNCIIMNRWIRSCMN